MSGARPTSLCVPIVERDCGLRVVKSVVRTDEESINERLEIRAVQYWRFCVNGVEGATVKDTSDIAIVIANVRRNVMNFWKLCFCTY